MSTESKITSCAFMLVAAMCIGLLARVSDDIHAIRETLEPKSLTFGAEPPPCRARVDFRDNSHQEPEVTLL